MIIVFLAALVLFGTATALVLRAIVMPRTRAVHTVGRIQAYGFSIPAPAGDARSGAARAAVDRLANRLGSFAGSRIGTSAEAEMRRLLMSAGLYRLTPGRFLGYRLLCAFSVPIVTFWGFASIGTSPLLVIVLALLGGMLGWIAPMRIVQSRRSRRMAELERELPELIDLLVVTVEAGLGFTGSLQVAADKIHGPLGDEVRLTMQEQNMGLSMHDALRNLVDRCDSDAVRSFVRSVLQGEALGVSIGQIMRNLSVEMRQRRRASAEERAQKAPVKMLFPLIFLIFPAMFVVLLAPAFFSISKALSGGGL